MSPRRKARLQKSPSKRTTAKSMSMPSSRRASIFRNGANQAVRLPQELRFPEEVKEVRIRKQGDSLVLSPIRPNWTSFFALKVDVPDDFLADRGDSPPQEREPM
jgi:antitoxin VapB